MATALILLPVAAALAIWILPMPGSWAAPAAPISRNPAVSITMPRTPFVTQSATTCSAASVPVITYATSTSPGMSSRLRWQGRPN